ncbi:MAG: type II toxin-antitoxin system MqsA family antitoxin [Chloroflexi bacterium]|nr:type II toxin-antitoxin system MqsA family antitoxin [Chloroflexota bacterium]
MKTEQCEYCDGNLEMQHVLVPFRFKGETIYVENVPTWVCAKCGEKYFDAPVYKRLEQIARQRKRIRRAITFPLAKFSTPSVHSRIA